MIDALTIIRNTDEKGNVEFTVNGSLPIDECARALIIVAFNAERPKKEEIKTIPMSDKQIDPGTG